MSKGSNRRPENYAKLSDNWGRIFGNNTRRGETANRPGFSGSHERAEGSDSKANRKPGT